MPESSVTTNQRHADKTQKRAKHAEMTQSDQVLSRKRHAAELAAGIRTFSETGAKALEERLQAVLEAGEEMPDIRHLFELLGRLVQNERQQLDQADEERWIEGMHLLTLRQEARKARDELYGSAVAVRQILVSLYGSKRCRFQFGLSKRTPRGAEDLELEMARLVRRLSSPSLALPRPEAPGVTADPEGWAKTLRPGVERLHKLLAELERRKIGKRDRVLDKNRALQSFDKTCLLTARTAEALLELAGEDELARRLRAAERQRAKRPKRSKIAVVIAEKLEHPVASLRSKVVSMADWLGQRVPERLLRALRPDLGPNFKESAVREVSRRSPATQNL